MMGYRTFIEIGKFDAIKLACSRCTDDATFVVSSPRVGAVACPGHLATVLRTAEKEHLSLGERVYLKGVE